MNQKENTFKSKPVDLVKHFYDQDIDHKALEKALTQRKNTAKGFTNFSLDPCLILRSVKGILGGSC